MSSPTREQLLARRLASLRWGTGSGEPLCPSCGTQLWQSGPARPRRFGCSRCHFRSSVTAGSMLHRAKLPLQVVWDLCILLSNGPVSSRAIARSLGLRQATAWRWAQRLMGAAAMTTEPLVGLLFGASAKVPLRPPHPQSPPVHAQACEHARSLAASRARWATTTALTDCDGSSFRFVIGTRPARRIQVLTSLPTEPMLWLTRCNPARAVAASAEHAIRHVYRSVSARWLPRYLHFLSMHHRRASSPQRIAETLLTGPVVAFPWLRPAGGPASHFDALVAPRFLELVHRASHAHGAPMVHLEHALRPPSWPAPSDA